VRSRCKICGGGSICKHQGQKGKFKDCREAKDKEKQRQQEIRREKGVSTTGDRDLGQGRVGVKEGEGGGEAISPGEAWVGRTFRKKFST